MPKTKYQISLTSQERAKLKDIISKGKCSARTIMKANVLLASDRSGKKPMTVSQAAMAFNTSRTTVQNIRERYMNGGLEAAISRKKRVTPPVPAKVTGDVEARIIALACTNPPEGYARWTVRLLAEKAVELGYVEELSHTTVNRVLKKTNTSLI